MIIILSGASGSGKTSTCKLVAEAARTAQIPTGGILCAALFQDGRKVGIECSDLAINPARQARKLAGIRQDWAGLPPVPAAPPAGSPRNPAFDDSDAEILRYGMWEFSKSALRTADQAIIGYAETHGDNSYRRQPILFVDEIGPLELDRGTGLVGTLALLDRAARQRGVNLQFLVVARPDIAARLKERWPDSMMVAMAGTNYMETAQVILAALNQAAGGNC